VGPENVGAPVVEDTWREEAVGVGKLAAPDAAPPPPAAAADADHKPALAIRRKRPPEEIEVLMGRDGPTALRGQQTTARVLIAAGPYRLSGEWWQPTPDKPEAESEARGWAREYWDVHASDGAVYRLHRDGRSGRFFLDGYYD